MEEASSVAAEDDLLDPIAKSILRDLLAEPEPEPDVDAVAELIDKEVTLEFANIPTAEAEVEQTQAASKPQEDTQEEQAPEQETQEEHVNTVHLVLDPITIIKQPEQPVVVILPNGQAITCDDYDRLEPNEIVHCNQALEQNQNDSTEGAKQGGQSYIYIQTDPPSENPTAGPSASPTKTPSRSPVYPTSSPIEPTRSPSKSPTETTGAPSYHPTLHGDPYVLRGTIFYDLNANGSRDSNVFSPDYGTDVEYSFGLGGVTIQLLECDPETNMGLSEMSPSVMMDKYEEGENSYAGGVSRGVDVLMKPQLVGKEEKGGEYSLTNIRVNRAYFIHAQAPAGYLFSGGICNDDVPGWECTYSSTTSSAQSFAQGGRSIGGGGRKLLRGKRLMSSSNQPADVDDATPQELQLGISQGRSDKCVSVDRAGLPSSHLDLGVMKIGDSNFDDTDVELKLDLLDNPEIKVPKGRGLKHEGRSLLEVLREKGLVDGEGGGPASACDKGETYCLDQKDKDAIGIVTSEVIASAIHFSLLQKGAVLDSVTHLDVFYIAPEKPVIKEVISSNSTGAVDGDAGAGDVNVNSSDGSDEADVEAASAADSFVRDTDNGRDPTKTDLKRRGAGGKLSVALLVRGHYNRNLNVDFDYIVQDSINRDTHTIRRQLTHYNQDCRDQTTKVVDMGFTLDDFLEVHTNRGVKNSKPSAADRLTKMEQQQELEQEQEAQAFSAACNQNRVLPDYFTSSLGGIDVKTKSEGFVTYVIEEGSLRGNPWAVVGGILAVVIFALAFGFFLFRKGLTKKQENGREARVTHLMMTQSTMEDEFKSDANNVNDPNKMKDKLGDGMMSEKEKSIRELKLDNSIKSGGSSQVIGMSDRSPSTMNMIAIDENRELFAQSRGLSGMMRAKYGNMTAALDSERRRFSGSGSNQNDVSSRGNVDVSNGSNSSQRSSRRGSLHHHNSMKSLGSNSDFKVRLQDDMSDRSCRGRGDDSAGSSALKSISKSGTSGRSRRSSQDRNSQVLHNIDEKEFNLYGSVKSRNAVPTIIGVDLHGNKSNGSNSSSSESESSSSDDSSDSSASDESESSAQERAHKKGKSKKNNRRKGADGDSDKSSKSKSNHSGGRRRSNLT